MENYSRSDNFTLSDYSPYYYYDEYDYIDEISLDYNYNYNYPGGNTYDIRNISGFMIWFVAECIIISIALPLTLVVIYALCRLVRKGHVAPIFVINLLVCSLIQLCCLIFQLARPETWMRFHAGKAILHLSLVASVWFMVCVALERYLVIACPLWYNSRRKIMISVLVCVVVWILPLLFVLILYLIIILYIIEVQYCFTVFGVFLLLPLPLFIFFLGGTLKALSASRVPSDEKRRIVGILVLVLFIYMLLFLPFYLCLLVEQLILNNIFRTLSIVFLRLTPLADLTLYVFMKKGTIDKLLSSVCCCTMDSSEISSSPV